MKNSFFLTAVTLFLVSCVDKEVKWDATGVFEATEVVVGSQANGLLWELALEQGQALDSGQVVGLVDTTQVALAVEQLRASLRATQSQSQDIAKQIAATQQQITWQKSERARFQKLVSENAATQKQVDDIVNQIAVLERQLAAQRSTLGNANRGVDDQAAALREQIAQGEDQLRKCRIVSPLTGTVLVEYTEQGEVASVGKPLFSVADMSRIYLRAYITADLLTQMKLGQKVKVYSDFGAKGQREYSGVVSFISDKAEFTPKTVQTRDERANLVYAVKINVPNDGYLKIGMYGQMVLEK